MKKIMSGLVLSALGLSFFGGAVSVHADADSLATATTPATIEFEGGTISLSATTPGTSFASANTTTVYTSGLEEDSVDNLIGKVSDLRGNANDSWTLTVAAGQWQATEGTDQTGADRLNTTTLSLGAKDISSAQAVESKSGDDVYDIDAGKLHISIPQTTLLLKGSYSNELTWTLQDGQSETQG